jgi:hypothetical protein
MLRRLDRESAILHQVHPVKLAADIAAAVAGPGSGRPP